MSPSSAKGRGAAQTLAVLLAALLTGLAHGQDPAAGSVAKSKTGRTLGFVLESFQYRRYLADPQIECPSGFVKRGLDALLANLSEPERDRINRPENAAEREELETISYMGELCLRPDWLPAAPHRVLQGKVSYGMDLDGGDTSEHPAPNTCRHQNFTGPNGETGVDNQLYRATGCMDTGFRFTREGETVTMEATYLMDITGVDDLRNDDEVRVGLYAGLETPEVTPGATEVLPHASIEIDTNPRFAAARHVPARGRIKDGVLTTDPFDFTFEVPFPGEDIPFAFRGARLRLQLMPDGTAEGELAGYQNVQSAYWQHAVIGFLGDTRYFCPSFYAALKTMADGYPDPATGECTGISTSFSLKAAPAFVIHPTPQQFAEAAAAETETAYPYGWERIVEQRKGLAGGSDVYIQQLHDAHEMIAPIVERELARREKRQSAGVR